MSVEATFVLMKCDGNDCKSQIGLSTDAHWENFENTWYAGVFSQFCPNCKDKPEYGLKQLADISFVKSIENFQG